jgi:DNA-binding transcriptional MerR regulator
MSEPVGSRGKAAETVPPEGKMTIGELAQRTGMTVRNIRAHQAKGILPPPEVHGRTGYYGPEHVARISLTREMQADGLNLEAIRRLLGGADGGGAEILDFTRALRVPFEDEAPEIVEVGELAAVWGADQELRRRAERLGILRALPDGRVEVISPRLQRAGTALAELGVRPAAVLATAESLGRGSERIAAAFVDLFIQEIWEPFDRAGRPEEDWPKVREALERVRPLASSALLAMFQITMSEATERASERTLRAAAKVRDRREPEPASRRGSRRRAPGRGRSKASPA